MIEVDEVTEVHKNKQFHGDKGLFEVLKLKELSPAEEWSNRFMDDSEDDIGKFSDLEELSDSDSEKLPEKSNEAAKTYPKREKFEFDSQGENNYFYMPDQDPESDQELTFELPDEVYQKKDHEQSTLEDSKCSYSSCTNDTKEGEGFCKAHFDELIRDFGQIDWNS